MLILLLFHVAYLLCLQMESHNSCVMIIFYSFMLSATELQSLIAVWFCMLSSFFTCALSIILVSKKIV